MPQLTHKRLSAAVLAAVVAALVAVQPTRAVTPNTPDPMASSPATRPAVAADLRVLQQRLSTDMRTFQSALGGQAALTDEAVRQANAGKVVPALHNLMGDFDELAATQPKAKAQAAAMQSQFVTLLSLYGDTAAAGKLQAQADSKSPKVATTGKSDQLLVQWWASAKDPAAQAKVADQVEMLAKAHPESDALTTRIMTMTQVGAASPALKDRMNTLVANVMHNPTATRVQAAAVSGQKLAGLADKPLTVTGPTVDGPTFSTEQFKGKVVLVDFWATWCGPCREELPRVKKLYADYHAKGLEIVGVSNDYEADALKKYTAENDMPWPELFDASAAGDHTWNPVTTGYGINGIPTMFLIDKKGVCRTVEAREQMEEMVPKLLAE